MFTFDIEPDGGEKYRVVATSRDVSHWERTRKGRSLAALERDMHMSQLEELAHLAVQRRAGYTGSLDDFRQSCDITPVDTSDDDDNDEAGPTQTAR